MKIVNRKEFLLLSENTVYSKYVHCAFENLCIKGESLSSNDFTYQAIASSIDHGNSDEFADKLFDSHENGTEMKMDFDCQGRDGLFEDDQLFAVWGREDIFKLVQRLNSCW